MSAPDRFIAWCKQEQASLLAQLELLEASKVLTGEDRGSGWEDTTAESKKRAKERLAELESLLTEAGAATVVKAVDESISPDATIKTDTTVKKVEAGSSPRGEFRNILSPASAFRCGSGSTNQVESSKLQPRGSMRPLDMRLRVPRSSN
jgi:hypothetical protein